MFSITINSGCLYKDSGGLFVVHGLEQKGYDCLNDCDTVED